VSLDGAGATQVEKRPREEAIKHLGPRSGGAGSDDRPR
jgi:hypothetical protein